MKSIKFLIKYSKEYHNRLIFAIVLMIFLAYINIIPAQLSQKIIDDGFIAKDFNFVLLFSLLLGFLYLFKSLLNYYSNSKFISISQNICSEIRRDVYAKVLNLPMNFFGENDSGYLNSRLSEVNSLQNLFSITTFKLIVSLFEFIIALIVLIKMDSRMALIICLPLPFFYFISNGSMRSYSRLTASALESSAKYSSKLNETLKGMEEIKISASENIQKEKIKKYDLKMMYKSIKQSKLLTSTTEILSFCMSILNTFVYIMGGYFVIKKNLSLGEFMALNIYVSKLYSPVISFSTIGLTIQPAITSLKRLQEFIFDIKIPDDHGLIMLDKIFSIEAKNLNFGYTDKLVLNNLSFVIKSGDVIKLSGLNGSGKSTLVKLILKLYAVHDGQILINKTDINKINKKSLCDKISVVSQKIFVFNDTLENNICKNFRQKLNELGVDQKIFSINIDDGTIIGENGFKLSGGQIQKIAIARALLKNADVYIFDEASSNIDAETKENLKLIIKNYLMGKIVIIIDHSNYFDEIVQKKINL